VSSRKNPLCRASCTTNRRLCWWQREWIYPGFSSGLPTSDPAIEQRFKRIHESLSSGVDLKRGSSRNSGPLCSTNGLVHGAALAIQGNLPPRRPEVTETIPDSEPIQSRCRHRCIFVSPRKLLTNILKHAERSRRPGHRHGPRNVLLRVSDDGRNPAESASDHHIPRPRVDAPPNYRPRGSWEVRSPTAGGTVVTAVIPLPRMLLTEPA